MNNNMSFFDVVIRPILVIIAFLIGIGMFLTASAATPSLDSGYKAGSITNTIGTTIPEQISNGTVSSDSIENKVLRIESVINQDEKLRKLYHGGIPTYLYETNLTEKTVQRIDKYPDGYIHIEKGQVRKFLTVEELAKQAVERKNIKVSRINSLKTRIEILSKSTNAVDAATLDKCKRLLERLERGSTTNRIDIVVTPQSK